MPANGDIYYYYGETLLKDYLSDTFSNSIDEFAKKAEQLFQNGIKSSSGQCSEPGWHGCSNPDENQ